MLLAGILKAAQYIQNTNIKVAFVSTNSISQGEQVGILWNELFNKYKLKIHFAHRTFKWSNEARGKAAVHVVIIGFANYDTNEKYLFEYDDIKAEPHLSKVKNINPYLVEGKDFLINKRRESICDVPVMIKGSMPNDGGHYLFTKEEKETFLISEPNAKKYFRLFIGGDELINNIERWCLWLIDADPAEIKTLKYIVDRIQKVKETRLKSKRTTTIKDANTPMLFGEIRQPKTNYLALPEVSSENRKYIPIEFISKEVIGSNKIYMIPMATKYLFGILNSSMHMSWVRQISGRLKSDFQYSTGIVYNNFPWPENPTDKQIKLVEEKAQKVLDTRKEFPNSSLADLYDPLTMPPALVKAHQELDKAVDLCYRPQPFPNETKRIEFLFELYEKYTQPLMAKTKSKKK